LAAAGVTSTEAIRAAKRTTLDTSDKLRMFICQPLPPGPRRIGSEPRAANLALVSMIGVGILKTVAAGGTPCVIESRV